MTRQMLKTIRSKQHESLWDGAKPERKGARRQYNPGERQRNPPRLRRNRILTNQESREPAEFERQRKQPRVTSVSPTRTMVTPNCIRLSGRFSHSNLLAGLNIRQDVSDTAWPSDRYLVNHTGLTQPKMKRGRTLRKEMSVCAI